MEILRNRKFIILRYACSVQCSWLRFLLAGALSSIARIEVYEIKKINREVILLKCQS